MPCWVVPAVAAEFWGSSLEHVLAEVAAGRVATHDHGGLLFVAVGPPSESEPVSSPRLASGRRPLAWASPGSQTVIVTPAEHDALCLTDEVDATATADVAETATASLSRPTPDTPNDLPESVHDEGEPAPLDDGPEEAPAPSPMPDEPPQWESIRSRASRARKAPPVTAREAA